MEAVVADEEGFNQLLGRCSVEGSKIWVSCNPESPYHWFYINFIKQAKQKNILYIHFTMDDNPSLSEDIKEEYKKMFSGVWAKRFIEGRWVIANGIIYDMFNEDTNVVEDYEIPYDDIVQWCIGVDYGTGNATAFILIGKTKEGIIYAVDEYYFAGRREAQEQGDFDAQKTDLEYSEDMRQFIADHYNSTNLNYRNIEIMVDPAANSFILQMRRFKMKSKRANNDVLDGIRTVASYFGSNKLFISSNCKNLIEELHVYSWDEKAQARGVDAPKKENDHCVTGDTLVKTIDGYKKIEDLVGTEGFVYTIDSYGNTVQKRYYDVRKTRENAKVITLVFENGEELNVTPDHLILTDLGWCEAQFLSKYDNIITFGKALKIIEKKKYQTCDVYNMEVEDVHCFAVTNSDIIIHNCCDALRYGVMKLRDKDSIANATRNVGLW